MTETDSLRRDAAAPEDSGIEQVERDAQRQMRRSRRSVWIASLMGFSLGMMLVLWALLGYRLSDRIQVMFGIVVAAEATVLGFILAAYFHSAQMGVANYYSDRLKALARKLADTSVRDSLTGLYNHGYLLNRLQQEISRAQRQGHSLSIVILDLNKFKEVNDRHGHLAGDQLLQVVAGAIRKEVREHDVVARYGGDEFCLILPEADGLHARDVVHRLRESFVALSKHLDGWNTEELGFGSGIACSPDDGVTVHALIASADARLYQEKQAHRVAKEQKSEALIRELFYNIGESVADAIDPTERLSRLAKTICGSLNLQGAVFIHADEEEIRVAGSFCPDRPLEKLIGQGSFASALMRSGGGAAEALERNEVITLQAAAAASLLPDEIRAALPGALWVQFTPIPIRTHSPAVLLLMGTAKIAAPPESGLARTLARLLGGAIQNSLNFETTRRQRGYLAALAAVGSLLLKSGALDERLRHVAQRAAEALNLDAVTILTDDPLDSEAILTSTYSPRNQFLVDEWERGLRQQSPEFIRLLKGSFGTLVEPLVIEEPADNTAVQPFLREIYRRGEIHSLLILPLRSEAQPMGVLSVLGTQRRAFDAETVSLIGTVADQIASSIQVALLVQKLEDSYEQLREAHEDAMLRLAAVAEARDPFTGNHLHRLRVYTEALARRLGLGDEGVSVLSYAAVVHDIGKLRIPDAILSKPGELSDEEWVLIRKHPIYGADLLSESGFHAEAREVARWHHERWDGSGYPDGLRGEEIPPCVRIVSVADVFDALTSHRPYKDAWPVDRAIAYIRDQRGVHFAPEVVDAFLTLAEDGTLETLAGGLGRFETLDPGLDNRLAA